MPAPATPAARHRVIIVGCGFGGLFAARQLRHAPVDVTVVDRTNHHLFQPLLYQMATGILSQGDIAPPIREVLRHQRNTTVLAGEVVGIDPVRRVLMVDTLGSRSETPYDSLILAAGSTQSYFGHDEFAADAPGLKTIDDALMLRGRIFGAFELAEQERDPAVRRELMTFVVAGAGPTGVEMAGQIAELSRRSLRDNFRRIDPAQTRVVLLDGGPKLLGAFPESLQRRARKDLEYLGVEIHLNTMVTGVDPHGVDTNSENPDLARLQTRTKVWAAGVQGSPIGRIVAEATGASIDRGGHVKVLPDCTLPGHPEIFVVGDLMSLDELPGLAEVAMQAGAYAGRAIARRVSGQGDPGPFKYRDLGTMATISRFRAVATVGPLRLWGFIGWLAWLVVHLVFLTGFKNRFFTLVTWAIAFIGRGRQERTITVRQTLGSGSAPTADGL